ncbi:MAG: hypothetical protein Q8K64_01915 [Sediminibacterium sp.]|nr:hypothetical protein [Sediminibacterium sp.]
MKSKKLMIALIIEGCDDDVIFGRVQYEDDLLVASAKTIEGLQKKMKRLLYSFHKIKPDQLIFDLQYDIAGLFDQKKYLNASVVADRAGISRGLMRQYIAGLKYPSADRTLKIQETVNELGKELQEVKVAARRGKMV